MSVGMRLGVAIVGTVAIGTAIAAGCSPSSPSSRFGSLMILPATESLRTGEIATFRAVGVRADGSQEDVAAQWVVTGDSVTAQGGPSTIFGASPGTAELRVSAAGLSAVRLLKVVPDLRGTWEGKIHHDSCSRISGGGPGFCSKNTFGTDYGTRLQIDIQSGALLASQVTVLQRIIGVLAGNVAVSGALDLEDGTTVALTDTGPSEMRFKNWHFELTALPMEGFEMRGAGIIEWSFINAWGPQEFVMPDATMRLTRQ